MSLITVSWLVVEILLEILLRNDFLEHVLRFFTCVVFHTELLDWCWYVFEVQHFLLEDVLQEYNDEANHSVLEHLRLSARTTLVHAVLNEKLDEFFREINLVKHAVENF